MLLRKIIAPVVVGGALLGGVASTATAYAAAPTTAVTTPATTTHSGNHPLRSWLKAHRHAMRKAGLAVSAKAIGVTPTDLRTELKSGKSIAQVAGEHNVTAQTVVNDLVSAADAKIAQAVTDNKITSARATKIEAALPAYLTKVVNHVF
jgi:hypothetical protein